MRRWPAAWRPAVRALAWAAAATPTTRPSCFSPTTPRTSGRPACSVALSLQWRSLGKVPPRQRPECGPCASSGRPWLHWALQHSHRGRGRATGRPDSTAGARAVSRLLGRLSIRMALDHPGGLRHPVVLCEVCAEEGRRRLVSTLAFLISGGLGGARRRNIVRDTARRQTPRTTACHCEGNAGLGVIRAELNCN